MTGYEKSKNYGGPEWSWRQIALWAGDATAYRIKKLLFDIRTGGGTMSGPFQRASPHTMRDK